MHPTNNISGALHETLPQYCLSLEPVLCRFLPDWSQIKSNVTSGSHYGCITRTAGFHRIAATTFYFQIFDAVTSVAEIGFGFWIIFFYILFFFFSLIVAGNCRNIMELCKACFFLQATLCCFSTSDSWHAAYGNTSSHVKERVWKWTAM